MTRSRREFLKESVSLGIGVLGAPMFPGMLQAALDSSPTPVDQETVFPKSAPPASTILALKIERLSKEPDERLTLSCLQGLVNREQPRVFLVYDHMDELWLDWLRERGDVKEIRWIEPKELYEKFLPLVRGLVVTDPDLPASINVATMLASVEGWLPVASGIRKHFEHVNVAMDLGGRWQKSIEAYRWFYSTYRAKMSRRVCANYDPGQFELRDYFVEFNVPMIWISHPDDTKRSKAASPAEEAQFARDLFRDLPPNIPCMGWWDHGLAGEEGCGENGPYSGADLASQYAKFEVCTAFDGYCRGVGNLSVHSGTTAAFRQKPAPPPPPLADKVCYAYTRTDGDGPNFWRQVYRYLWDQPDHGKVPVGWQTGPTASDLIPDIIDYFYKRSTPGDVFVNALTGIGYIREACYLEKLPKAEQEAAWEQYMDLSRRYFRRMDLSLLTTFEAFDLMPPGTLARFAELPGLKAIYRNYHRFKDTTAENATSEVNGVPVFRAILGGGFPLATPEDIRRAAAAIARQIRQFTPAERPAFLHLSLANWFVDMRVLLEVEKVLGPDYVAVRADHLPALYMESKKAR